MKLMTEAFTFTFSDDDWFNKVLVGGFYIVLSPLVIGIIMIMGFQVELSKRVRASEEGMPMWRNSKSIFKSGMRSFTVSVCYVAVIVGILALLGIPLFSVITGIVLSVAHFLLNPIIVNAYSRSNSVITTLNPLYLFSVTEKKILKWLSVIIFSSMLMLFAGLFGWMWIVVGWPLLIFLAMIIQTEMIARL